MLMTSVSNNPFHNRISPQASQPKLLSIAIWGNRKRDADLPLHPVAKRPINISQNTKLLGDDFLTDDQQIKAQQEGEIIMLRLPFIRRTGDDMSFAKTTRRTWRGCIYNDAVGCLTPKGSFSC